MERKAGNVTVQDETGYQFKPHERPSMPGSPATPDHPTLRRVCYILIGILVGITGGLGNALVSVNLSFAQGTLGLYPDESAWLLAAYFMTNMTANLFLVKYRQQFGLQPFIRFMLAFYVISTVLHLFVHDFWSSVLVRAAAGLAASGMSTLTVLYLMQGMPAAKRMTALMMGISIPQLATPIARIMSPVLLESGDWHMLYWLEMGLALAMLASILALPLPPSERTKAFEKEDFYTLSLLAPGLWLLIAVMCEGRIVWWTERAWIGWALAGSLIMIVTALILEHYRKNPLISTRWLGTREIVRLMFIAASVRILLSEQSVGSVGLLTVVGVMNDQMIMLNVVIVIASVAGMLTAMFTFNPKNVGRPITLSILLIVIASFMDASSTNLTRPDNFYVSQALISFASLLFMAQAMVIGISRTLLSGPQNFISFIVLFSMSQSLGGLVGSALLGTFQVIREKYHSHELIQNILMTDPIAAARIKGTGDALHGVIGDPALRASEGAALLAQQVSREANILAYNDVFLLVGVLAVIALIWGLFTQWAMKRRGEVSPVILLQQAAQARAAQAAAQAAKE